MEDHNEATQDSFSKRFRDNIDEMQESLKAHLASDLGHVDTSHRHLGGLTLYHISDLGHVDPSQYQKYYFLCLKSFREHSRTIILSIELPRVQSIFR